MFQPNFYGKAILYWITNHLEVIGALKSGFLFFFENLCAERKKLVNSLMHKWNLSLYFLLEYKYKSLDVSEMLRQSNTI